MKSPSSATGRLFAVILLSAALAPAIPSGGQPRLPAPGGDTVETVCGRRIADPYRRLENLQDPAVQRWFRQESDYARAVLDAIPGRRPLIDNMMEFDRRKAAKVYNLSITDNDRYFYLRQAPSDETGKLYTRHGFKGSEQLLFDPVAFSDGRAGRFTIGDMAPNDDGSLVVVALSPDGSEDAVLIVIEVDTGRILPDRIDRCRFASPSWLPDGKSFLYNRLNPASPFATDRQKNSRVFLHRAGTAPDNDRELFSATLYPELGIAPEEIPLLSYDRKSGRLFAFIESVDPRLDIWDAPAASVADARIPWRHLIRPEDDIHRFAATKQELYLYTPKDAPRFRLMKTPLDRPDIARAETVVPEAPDATLADFALTSEGLYYTRSFNGVREELYRKVPDGNGDAKIGLPFNAGTIRLTSRGFAKKELWAVMAGWTHDYRRFRYETKKESFRDETLSSKADYPEYRDLVTEELMVPSHDGVMVPLSVIRPGAMEKNGRNPVLIYGYGAYGNSMTPFFSPSMLLWMAKGGILAVAHVRGGGELGDAWHQAGRKQSKPNTWKDLIACAEHLVQEGYTSPGHIAINAGSAGGILVGRAMTERPDLFAAAMPQVGLMNALRGEQTPNGPVNAPEFGTIRDPEECKALIEMDAYLHLKKGVAYPATLITAGMNDPRVIAWQPGKFAARLQESTSSGKPVLFFTDFEAGHGIGDRKTKQFESLADILSFGLWQTGHPGFQPGQGK